MKRLKIGNKEYKIEFTIEASLYNECTTRTLNIMQAMSLVDDANENVAELIERMADVPMTALTLFYAGLLEYHSHEVQSIDDAKALFKELVKSGAYDEETDTDLTTWYGLLNYLIFIMDEDGFFKQIGLVQEGEKPKKVPQDHKKKATKTTEA